MADAKLTALTAAGALAAADLFYVSQSAASRKATGTQLLALVGTAYVPLAGGTMTGALTLPAGAVGTPQLMFTGAGATNGFYSSGANNISIAINGVRNCYFEPNATYIAGSAGLVIQSTSALLYFGLDGALALSRDAAATLAQRNGTAQQIFRLYNSYTDPSNYERLTLTGVAGTSVNITAETLGTGGDNLDLVLTPAGTGTVKTSVFAAQVLYAGIPGVTVPVVLSYNGNIGLSMGDTSRVSWSSNSEGQTAADTALFRNAAGVVEVTNGTAGTWRDLKLRNLLSTGYAQIDSGTLTASAPALNITQTWNANAAFTAAKINVTKTLSDGVGLLQDWQLGSVSKANIREDGVLTCVSVVAGAGYVNDLVIASSIILTTDAAATLAQRNSTTQQTFRLYNTYTDSSNFERLTLTGVAGASVNITAETLGTGGDNLDIVLTPAGSGSVVFPNSTYINSTGFGILSGIKCGTESSLNYYASGVRLLSSGEIAWTNTTLVNAPVDTALFRDSAGVVKVTDGGSNYRDLKLRNLLNVEYHQMTEMTAPSAPATNSVRIYAEDNGSGKTRLMALFATGAAQQLAIEP